MESIDYYDRPDYDKLTRILEKAKEIIPYFPKNKGGASLVDQDVSTLSQLINSFIAFREWSFIP